MEQRRQKYRHEEDTGYFERTHIVLGFFPSCKESSENKKSAFRKAGVSFLQCVGFAVLLKEIQPFSEAF